MLVGVDMTPVSAFDPNSDANETVVDIGTSGRALNHRHGLSSGLEISEYRASPTN